MSVFENRASLKLIRKTKRFVNRKFLNKRTYRKLARQERDIAALRTALARKETGAGGVRPENVVWVFGSARTGSSWLTFMMGALRDHSRWNEPLLMKALPESRMIFLVRDPRDVVASAQAVSFVDKGGPRDRSASPPLSCRPGFRSGP